MANEPRLDIKKVIAEGSQVTSLSNLQNRGVRNVKVLDEDALQEMIARAVDQVVSTQTQEERSKILADSRKQLQKLMNERDEGLSRAKLLESGKNELVAQIEKLEEELRLRRELGDQGEAAQARVKELEAENAWLRQEHDRMVEELDRALEEIKRLKQELEALREQAAKDQAALQGDLEAALGEVNALNERLGAEKGEAVGALESVQADREKIARDLDEARGEIDRLRARLEEQANARAEAEEARREKESADQEQAALRRRLDDALAEAERLKQEQAAKPPPPERLPLVILESPTPAAPPAPAAPAAAAPFTGKPGKGLDIGTVNLVATEQNEAGDVEIRLKRNVFIDVEITPYTKAMLTKLDVPYVIQAKRMYVLGEHAFSLANVLNRDTRRPMKDGLISAKEQDALPIMKMLIGSILGEARIQGEVCFYSVPGEPVDSDLSVAYHRDLFDAVLKSLGYKPSHIIEGHAVTFAELGEEDFTGIGVSCGGGMFNICVAYKSMPALTFSTSRSGDWVDLNVAQVLGIKPAKAAMIKEKGVDLMSPKNREEDAVAIYYRNLVKYNLTNIAERFQAAENMPTFKDPVTIVFSGGTSLAGGFIELVRTVFKELEFPIPVKELRMAKDPLNATAKGALVAAQLEMANQAST